MDEVIEQRLTQDPGLPRQNPTASYWQRVPHALANVKSSVFPVATDVVVIGSGVTGASVTKTILDNDHTAKVIVLEARSLCSGATGRNGGQLATNAGEIYAEYKALFGRDMAGKIASYTFQTCERVKEIVAEYAAEEAEYRDVTKVRTFLDQESFSAMKHSVAQMEEDHPNLRGIYKIMDEQTVRKNHGVHGVVGGISLPAGVMWPYRLVTKVFQGLLTKYRDRLSIETHTPVTALQWVDGSYLLKTPRGEIRARQVVHCTNGYVGHLLPKLRGLVFPLCGTMTVQDLGPSIPNNGSKDSYGLHYKPIYDEKNKTLADGLWYLTQNAKTGYYFIGGEKGTMDETLTANDTVVSPTSVDELQKILPKLFNYTEVKKDGLVSAWSGIMGFTYDSAPYVGRLPASVTGRQGQSEWIASAFNGYGMPYCWLAGEAVAKLLLGQGLAEWFPEAFMISDERLDSSRITETVKAIMDMRSSSAQPTVQTLKN